MGWFSKKKNSLPSPTNYEEESNEQTSLMSSDYQTLPVKSREDMEFEEQLAQRSFDRDYAQNALQAKVAVAQQSLQTAEKLVDVWRYSKMVEQNIAQIQGSTAIELAKISAKFQNQQTALVGIFGQRQHGLSGHFAILEKAMKDNDRELIVESLRGISTIVTSSPLQDFEKLAKAWEDDSKPLELDF